MSHVKIIKNLKTVGYKKNYIIILKKRKHKRNKCRLNYIKKILLAIGNFL